MTGAASFKSLHDIPSRPLPLFKSNDWIILYTSLPLISLMENICWVGVIYSLKLASIAGKSLARHGPTCVKWWFKTLLISLEEEWVTSSVFILKVIYLCMMKIFPRITFTPFQDSLVSGVPNENIVQNHLNIALLNVFWYLNGRYRHIFIP